MSDIDVILHSVDPTVREVAEEVFYSRKLKNATAREIPYMVISLFPNDFMKAQDILMKDVTAKDTGDWGVTEVMNDDKVAVFELAMYDDLGYVSKLRYYVIFNKKARRAYLVRLDTDSVVKIKDVIKNLTNGDQK